MTTVICKLNCLTPRFFSNVHEIPTQHLLFISYAQIVILPTYFHGYLLFIASFKQLILPTYFYGFRSDNH